MRRRRLLRAFLAYLTVQVLAIGAGLTVASLLGSSLAGLLISNVGAVAGVLFGLRIYFTGAPQQGGDRQPREP